MRILLPLTLLLSACASFPSLEGTISDAARQAPYPKLTKVPMGPETSDDQTATLQARVDALQGRAIRVRQIDIAALQ